MRKIGDLVNLFSKVLGFRTKDWARLRHSLKPLEGDFLDLVLDNESISDETVAYELLRTDFKDSNYSRIRNSLRDKLINEVFQFSPTSITFSDYQKAYYQTQKTFAVLKILRGLQQNHIVKYLADRLITRARKYSFNEIRLEVSRYLFKYYSMNELDKAKAQQYGEEVNRCMRLLQYETQIEIAHYQFNSNVLSEDKEVEPHLLQAELLIKILKSEIPNLQESVKFNLFYNILAGNWSELKGKHEEALTYAQQGFKYFEERPFEHRAAKKIFLNAQANSFLRLKKYTEARQTLEKSLTYRLSGRNNWFVTKRLLLHIESHLKNYSSAYDHYIESVTNIKFRDQPNNLKIFFKISGLFLKYLIITGRITEVDLPSRRSINGMIKELHESAAHRRIKVPLIIGELIFNIMDRDYDAMEERIYALKDFCSRNLMRQSSNFRSNCFIKMLLTIPVNHFHPVAVKRKAEKFVKKLKEIPYELSDHPSEFEIIPYEVLWEIILEDLEAPKRRRKSSYTKQDWMH